MDTANLDRVDVYLDQRPRASIDVTDGHAEVSVNQPGAAKTLRVDGFTQKPARREPHRETPAGMNHSRR